MLQSILRRVQRPHDEQGATLAFCLVIVIVVSVSGAAVLSQQTSTANHQKAWKDRGASAAEADSALAFAAGALRWDPKRGRVGNENCGTLTTASNFPTGDTTSEQAWSGLSTDPNTGSLIPPPVIYQDTKKQIEVRCMADVTSGTYPNNATEVLPYTIQTVGGGNNKGNAVYAATDTDQASPFCYDQGGPLDAACEPGIYVGPSANKPSPNAGGLTIWGSGSDNATVLKSNSNVGIRGINSVPTNVTVHGNADVRGKCDAGFTADNYPGTGCDRYAALPEDPTGSYAHRNIPGVKADGTLATNADGSPWRNWDAYVGNLITTVQLRTCSWFNDMFIFEPGIYTNVSYLNTLSTLCSGLFWFRPGVYVFDFPASASNGKWGSPPRSASQVIAGTPQSSTWSPPTFTTDPWKTPADLCPQWRIDNKGAWNFACGFVPAPTNDQLDKEMVPNKTVLDKWVPSNADGNASQIIDGLGTSILKTGTQIATDTLSTWQTSIPENASDIRNVRLNVAYGTGPSSGFTWGYPRIRVNVNEGYDDCFIALPNNWEAAHNGVAIEEVEVGDLQKMCVAKGSDALVCPEQTTAVPFPAIDTPCALNRGATVAQWKNNNNPFPATGWTYKMLNSHMKVEFQVQATGSATAEARFDGARIKVDYDGRPAPSYPGGCDRTQDGVQFILAGHSHIGWDTQNVYTEFCAGQRTADNPNGIAVYAMAEKNAPPATNIDTLGNTTDAYLQLASNATTWKVTAASFNNKQIKYTTADDNDLAKGDQVTISGLNGTWQQTQRPISEIVDSRNFKIDFDTNPGGSPGGPGTVTLLDPQYAVSGASYAGGKITYLSTSQPFSVNDKVTITGFSGTGAAGYNVPSAKITATATDSFTIDSVYPGAPSIIGTAVATTDAARIFTGDATKAFQDVNDGNYLRLTWPKNRNTAVTATLPANFIPSDAFVDSISVGVASAATGSGSNYMRIKIEPNGSGTQWSTLAFEKMPPSTTDGTPAVNRPTTAVPLYDPITAGYPTLKPATGNPLVKWYSIGDYYQDPVLNNSANTVTGGVHPTYPATCPSTGECLDAWWPWGSQLMRAVREPDGGQAPGLNGAKITVTFVGSGAGGAQNEAILDAIRVRVRYRPAPVQTRPIASATFAPGTGKMTYTYGVTTPSMGQTLAPGEHVKITNMAGGNYNTSDSVVLSTTATTFTITAPATPLYTTVTGGAVQHVGGLSLRPLRGCNTIRPALNPLTHGYTGVDWDWAPKFSLSAFSGDSAYIGNSAHTGTGQDDASACPALLMDGNDDESIKFHTSGSIFVPSGAVDLRGWDNDAAFVSGGTLVRTLSTFRWKNGGANPTFGDNGTYARNDRHVFLRAYDTRGTSQLNDDILIASESLKINDHPTPGMSSPGGLLSVDWYVRRKDT